MKIEFSDHALDQLKARPIISKKMVLETIKSPDKILPSFKKRKLFRKHYDQGILEVVTIEESDKMTIITEYFLET